MNKKELEAFAKQATNSIKSEADFTDFRKMLTKVTVEAALNVNSMNTLVMLDMSNSTRITPAMAIPQRLYLLRMMKLI